MPWWIRDNSPTPQQFTCWMMSYPILALLIVKYYLELWICKPDLIARIIWLRGYFSNEHWIIIYCSILQAIIVELFLYVILMCAFLLILLLIGMPVHFMVHSEKPLIQIHVLEIRKRMHKWLWLLFLFMV